MASQSLYRKWRSQTFSDLVGQEPVIRTLKNALSSGNLAHAYLFTGPRGTGKTSTARLLAKTINCLYPKDGEPCNDCEQCHEITVGSSFNVIEIDAASNRGIDSIRELREKVMVPPTNGKYKVYILDEAHMLTTEAFNALLKTLEEPPPHAIFVMATTDVHKMLPTVLSRCQRFDFKRFSTRQLVDRLRFVAEQEQVILEAGAAELIARAAAGGMRDALSLLDQAIAYSGNEISLNQVQVMLGVADPRAIQKFVRHIADLDSPAGLHLIHELSEAGADLRQSNVQIAEYCRAMMLTRAGASIGEILDLTEDEMSEIVQMAQLFSLEELTEYARIFAQNDLVQKSQSTPQLGLELALLACIELHRRMQSGQSIPSTASTPVIQPRPASTPVVQPRPASTPAAQPRPVSTPAAQPRPVPTPVVQPHPASTPAAQPHPASTPAAQPHPASTPAAQPHPASTPAAQPHPAPVQGDPGAVQMNKTSASVSLQSANTEFRTSPPSTSLESQPVPKPNTGLAKAVNPSPDLEHLPQLDESNKEYVSKPSSKLQAQAAPMINGAPKETMPSSMLQSQSVPQQFQTLQPADGVPVTVSESPSLTVDEVKEKWEYIKKRIKSRKDGHKVAALLGWYAIVAVEGTREIPVVVIQANTDIYHKALQNPSHHATIEWAMKVELSQECKLRLLPPGQSLQKLVSMPAPASRDAETSLSTSTIVRTPQRSPYREPSISAPEIPQIDPKCQVQSVQVTEWPPQQNPIVSAVSSVAIAEVVDPSPLARTSVMRDNTLTALTATGETRQEIAAKKVKSDQVVQEAMRMFKAEIKNIQLK
jgi:DNA polymerase-3 subunit gamma/tau